MIVLMGLALAIPQFNSPKDPLTGLSVLSLVAASLMTTVVVPILVVRRRRAEREHQDATARAANEQEAARIQAWNQAEAARARAAHEQEAARIQAWNQAEAARLQAEGEAARVKAWRESEAARLRQEEEARTRAAQEAETERIRAAREAETAAARQARWNDLCARFGIENAKLILGGRPWVGATREMMIEALGQPVDVDERVLKTKTVHTFKYRPLGKNRFGLRISLENGVVMGWDEKT